MAETGMVKYFMKKIFKLKNIWGIEDNSKVKG